MPRVYKCPEQHLALKPDSVVGVGKPLQAISLVVPIVYGEKAGTVRQKMLSFRAECVTCKLAEAAHIRAPEEACLRLKTLRSVLIHHVVFHFARAVLKPVVKGRAAFVRAIV